MSAAVRAAFTGGGVTTGPYQAHAKVNLGLAVIALRGDGYHELETVMARIGLADELTVVVAEAGESHDSVQLSVEVAPGLPGSGAIGSAEDNLATRAAYAYLRARRTSTPAAPFVRIDLRLVKRIPIAAGLGGGSADAGTVLRALAERLPVAVLATTGAPDTPAGAGVDTMTIARALGSDVPFLTGASNAALARGRGERLAALDAPRLHLVLANPGGQVSAADAYANLVGFTPRLRFAQAMENLAKGVEPGWPNALQPGVLRLLPGVRPVLGALREAGLLGALLSGSGPTCFGVARDEEHARSVAAALAAQQPAWWVRADSTA